MQYGLLSRVHLVDVEELSLSEVEVVPLAAVTFRVQVEMLDHVDNLALVLLIHHQVLAKLVELRPELHYPLFI